MSEMSTLSESLTFEMCAHTWAVRIGESEIKSFHHSYINKRLTKNLFLFLFVGYLELSASYV